MNLATVIAVYAVISRELGLPLRFPGPAEKKAVLITGVHLNRTGTPEELAEAIVFMALPKALFIVAVKGIQTDRFEIRPGQANQLKMMSRVAPGFILKQMSRSVDRMLRTRN
jgi:hypothetical protein